MSAPITLITGTSRGIGRHLAEHYAERGHQVLGFSRTTPDIMKTGYHHWSVDVTDQATVRKAFDDVRARFGRIDHLINNAGISSLNHSLTMPLQTAAGVMNANFLSTFLMCQEGVRLMKPGQGGRIVNFSSVSVPLRTEGVAAYAAAKAAIEELTRILGKEYGEFGITVNCVGPSAIDTHLTRSLPLEKLQEMLSRQSIKTQAVPADVANVVDFFLAPASHLVTGQILYLGGFG